MPSFLFMDPIHPTWALCLQGELFTGWASFRPSCVLRSHCVPGSVRIVLQAFDPPLTVPDLQMGKLRCQVILVTGDHTAKAWP